MKICSQCKEEKDIIFFGKDKSHKDGLKSRCKSCLNLNTKIRRKTNPIRIAEIERKSNLKCNFGISEKQFDEILIKQNYCCGICGVLQNDLSRKFDVDHNHITKKVRGLLCSKCNKALGLLNCDFGDSLLFKSIIYLRENG
jgi:Recombination endonuclease VII